MISIIFITLACGFDAQTQMADRYTPNGLHLWRVVAAALGTERHTDRDHREMKKRVRMVTHDDGWDAPEQDQLNMRLGDERREDDDLQRKVGRGGLHQHQHRGEELRIAEVARHGATVDLPQPAWHVARHAGARYQQQQRHTHYTDVAVHKIQQR
ncbi:hypothetical protein B0H10DRAFT_2192465 [Mycena sp. CBHHK59/15]|nr:hypothetical protein B0H10DRAFT_2192465 [Mycena sp. CBHHK59/15]